MALIPVNMNLARNQLFNCQGGLSRIGRVIRFGVPNQLPHRLKSTVVQRPLIPSLTGTRVGATGPWDIPKPPAQTPIRALPSQARSYSELSPFVHGDLEGLGKPQAKIYFEQWKDELTSDDVVVYTDASWRETVVGYGFAVYSDGQEIQTGQGKMMDLWAKYDGEIIGAWKGLQWVLSCEDLRERRIWVCLDATEGVARLKGRRAQLPKRWAHKRFEEAMGEFDVRVKWCPGHCGVEGNHGADKLAKRGLKLLEVEEGEGDMVGVNVQAV